MTEVKYCVCEWM